MDEVVTSPDLLGHPEMGYVQCGKHFQVENSNTRIPIPHFKHYKAVLHVVY